jgi:L-aminopeptidase/D-esterase-like protein
MSSTSPSGLPRARALGIEFAGTSGTHNVITDVPGVEVGYVTKIEGQNIRTGVTAILPRGKEGVGSACAAAFYSLNGNGEMTGTIWIEESGSLSMPILITNTHAVGQVHSGVIEWVVENKPSVAAQWLLPVVAETWDGYLNEINEIVISKDDAKKAINSAASGPIEEGSVGGGTGMNCYQYKGGSGTSSRVVKYADHNYTVGAFVQANFGSREELIIRGVSMQNTIIPNPMEEEDWFEKDKNRTKAPGGAGSVIVIIATDAPLLPLQCKALAKRVPLGLARTGTTGSHFSGDIFLAFSTANKGSFASNFPNGDATESDFDTSISIPWGYMDAFYTATVQAVEEAVINALVVNKDMEGRDGHKSYALTHELIRLNIH